MKKTYLFMLALVMGALIVSCTNQETEETVMASDSPEQDETPAKEPMPASEAQAMIQAYWPLHGDLVNCADEQYSKVPQYISIPGTDLKSMVAALGDDPSTLYASLVEKEIDGEMVTALVFAGKTKAQEGTENWTYFDFTQPCPTTCDTMGIAGIGN